MGNRQDTTGNLKELVERLAKSDQGHRKRHLSSTKEDQYTPIYASNALFSSPEKRFAKNGSVQLSSTDAECAKAA
jgi:hypothetical protein